MLYYYDNYYRRHLRYYDLMFYIHIYYRLRQATVFGFRHGAAASFALTTDRLMLETCEVSLPFRAEYR